MTNPPRKKRGRPPSVAVVDHKERLWSLSVPEPNSGCWLFLRSMCSGGYGRLRYGRKLVRANRFSYLVFHGEIPPGLYVCHKCDVTCCVNPDHLWLGTARDNVHDMIKKGRAGDRFQKVHRNNHNQRLTVEDVLAIRERARHERYATLAAEFGISLVHVQKIVSGERWRLPPIETARRGSDPRCSGNVRRLGALTVSEVEG